jgi:hypothetical protein
MPSGREPGHVRPELGDEQLRSQLADPGDLIQPLDRVGERGDQLGKLGVELGQVGVQRVHLGQQLAQQEGVLVAEVAGECLFQQRQLGAQPGTGQLREDLRITLALDEGSQHGGGPRPRSCRWRPRSV